jgi:hypothetical protein
LPYKFNDMSNAKLPMHAAAPGLVTSRLALGSASPAMRVDHVPVGAGQGYITEDTGDL